MRLAILIYQYFPYGGQQRDFLKIAKQAVANGHDVTVYCMRWDGVLPEGIAVQHVPVSAKTRHLLYQRYTEWVQDRIAEEAYDLVLGFNKMPGLDMYFAADPCFAAKLERDKRPLIKYLPRYRHFLAYEQAVFRTGADTRVMLLSPQQLEEFCQYYPGSKERLHVVPPGLSSNRFPGDDRSARRKRFRDAQNLNSHDIAIVQVGSGFRIKGVDRSIRSVAALPDDLRNRCKLYIVGQGKSGSYRRLARRLGVSQQVLFLGGRDDIPDILSGCDYMLHPAIQESAGYSILEGIVNGLPVLTTDTCGYAYHVEHSGAGVVSPSPFSQQSLNDALRDMLQSDERLKWQENGLAYGKAANLRGMADYVVTMLEQEYAQRQSGQEAEV